MTNIQMDRKSLANVHTYKIQYNKQITQIDRELNK